MDDAMRILCDKDEIYEVLLRYTRGLDRLDRQVLRQCYHPDALHDHGMFKGLAHDFADYSMNTLVSMDRTMHSLQNALITVHDRATATAESYCIAYHRVPSTKSATGYADHTVLVRYLDRFERRDGGPWRIADRIVVFEWSRIDAIEREWKLTESYQRGRRDKTDALYGLPVLPAGDGTDSYEVSPS